MASQGKGCLGGLLGFLLFFIWSAALAIHFTQVLISPPSVKNFMTTAFRLGVKYKAKMTDEAFFARAQAVALNKPEQRVNLIPQLEFKVDSKGIREAKNPDELYAFLADSLIDPVYSPDSGPVGEIQSDYRFIKELDDLNDIFSRWDEENLYSHYLRVKRVTTVIIIVSLVLAALMVLVLEKEGRLRAPGVIAFIVGLPWAVVSFAVMRGPKWMAKMDMFSKDEAAVLIPAVQEVFHNASWLGRMSFWAGLALIILSIVMKAQTKKDEITTAGTAY